MVHYDDALGDYVEHLLSCTPNRLNGLRVVVDTGNGAAAGASPRALRRMGAEVLAIHSSPDGYNINEGCGSTHMADLRAAVVEHGYDVGIAHDGDADRCLAVDAQGNVVDGDEIMAILALAMRDQGKLAQDTVVATVMSNLGFKLAMRDAGITMVETGVGDRYVLEAMRAARLHARRRAERARRAAGLRHHRRRDADRPAPAGPDGRHAARPCRSWPRS